MQSVEVKFLFEGILFTTTVHVLKNLKGSPRLEFFVTFSTRYLIKEYSRSYKFVFENERFAPIFSNNQKERELIRSIQDALIKHPEKLLAA